MLKIIPAVSICASLYSNHVAVALDFPDSFPLF